jgi:esterase/lipase superfamily enzyme
LAALVMIATLAACASRPGPLSIQTVASVPSAKVVKVYAVTTRNRVLPTANIFDAGKAVAANYAEMTVSIPPGHKVAQIEWPGKKPDASKTFAVVGQSVIDQTTFLNQIRAEKKASGRVGIFVHGYNYNFEESLFRLAQMSADKSISGSPILFSWPSQGALAGYVADKEAATYSRDYLANLLIELTSGPGDDEIYLFAHSMGGWLVVETLRQLKLQGRDDVLSELRVLLAAPDIDTDVFRGQMKVVGPLKHPLTILVSGDDRALLVSRYINASTQRVGTIDVRDPRVQAAAVEAGVQLVDISTIKASDPSNHNRFADAVALYPALTSNAKRQGLGDAGAFVFDAAAATISSPFRIVSGVLKQ